MNQQAINALRAHTPAVDGTQPRAAQTTAALLQQAYDMLEDAEKKIAAQEERIRRYNSPGSLLVLIDLDRFKLINDTAGHQAGDECLKMAAAHLLGSIRILDGAARLGGDEFAVLLTQTDAVKAMVRVEDIRQKLNDMTIEWQGQNIAFGASIGIMPVSAEMSFEEAYVAADRNLYADKRTRKG